MGVNALVFCDCLERGGVRRLPRPEWEVYVQSDGCRESAARDHGAQAAFGRWHETACPHDYGILIHRLLEPAHLTALLRARLGDALSSFPVLINRTLADNRGEDCLTPGEVKQLAAELQALRCLLTDSLPPAAETMVSALEELARTAIAVNKPLVV